jgi:uncharacterized protein
MLKTKITTLTSFLLILLVACVPQQAADTASSEEYSEYTTDIQDPDRLHVLFLGDDGHHQPAERLQQIIPWFAEQGIYFHYTDRQEDLNLKNLQKFDAFMFYGNRAGLTQDQESALLTYVHEGGAFVAIHTASASFNDSDAFVNLLGGAFKAHGDGTFRVEHVEADHPVKQGVPNFESWDETYVHMKLNPDMTVLSERVEGDHREPWTWVRNHGDGRVFYTAWGHDERTWGTDGFKLLLNRGIRWSIGDWALDADFSPPALTFGEGELPYYPPGQPWGTIGDPITEIQNPLSPEESREHIVVDPDFRVELFASEDDVINPIDMTWDEQGRLWVTETVDYPNKFMDDREGNDRIKILEDTNGDGRADKITVFAEGLNIPTSLVLTNGGVLISQAPDFIFLKDTTGDDKADHREVIISGWGTFDTHAGPSNLHYGFDNQIWGVLGYSAFEGTVGGVDHQFSSGIYRFKPDGSSLEYVSNTTNNTWGLGFNEEGIVFASTANRDVPVHSVVPNRFYNNIRGMGQNPRLPMIADDNRLFPLMEEIRQVDQHGRYTSASGFHIYGARDFPEEYWNKRAFISDPTGHLMGEFIMERDGSTYSAKNIWNMMVSLDEWFSPIQAKVGPDGALWVLDWYNIVIQHNPTPEGYETGEGNAYINELRDQDHARIYRVVYKNSDHRQTLNLKDAAPEELVDALSNDNMFWRLTAQRLLVERGEQDVVSQLIQLVNNQQIDELGLNPGSLHAIWTLHGLGALDGSHDEALEAVTNALNHPASSVRRSALMTIPRTEDMLEKVLSADFLPVPEAPGDMWYTMPTHTMMSSDPQVRVAALLAVAEMPSHEKAGIAAAEMMVMEQNANDRWLRDAVTAAGANNEHSFLSHVLTLKLSESADSTFKENVKIGVQRVARHYALGENASEYAEDFLLMIEEADETIAAGFVEGLAQGWPEGTEPELSQSAREQLGSLRSKLSEEQHESLDELAENFGVPDLFGRR